MKTKLHLRYLSVIGLYRQDSVRSLAEAKEKVDSLNIKIELNQLQISHLWDKYKEYDTVPFLIYWL
jgi:hypothetical protein